MPQVNPEIVRWGRETVRLTPDDTAAKLVTRDAVQDSGTQTDRFSCGNQCPSWEVPPPIHGYFPERLIALEVFRHAPAELYLDPANPRLADEEFSFNNQEKILRWLWRNKSVKRVGGFHSRERLLGA